jgi:hypothetical protein
MKKPWENDSCEAVKAYFTIYPVPMAAAFWCGIPPSDVDEQLSAATEIGRAIYRHPYISCLEPRCRAIHEAIEKGSLPCSRENGKVVDSSDHVAPERRHVSRQHIKEWIAKEFPSDRPAFLFDEIERKTHSAINAESFRALQADRDSLYAQLEKAKSDFQKLRQDKEKLERVNKSLMTKIEKHGTPGERAETTYQNIIGAMLDLILKESPGGQAHSIFTNQAVIIQALLGYHEGKPGISARTLEEKFAEAKRSLNAS